MLKIIVHGLKHRIGQQLAQFFALQVDVAVGATREVDAFERAGAALQLIDERHFCYSAIFFDDEHMAPPQFFYLADVHIENGLDGGPFRCHHDYLFVGIIKSRAYACRIAHHESIAMADEASHDVAAVEFFARTAQ